MQHDTGKGQNVRPRQRRREALVIARQPPETGSPGEAPLDHPATGQQDEAPFGLGQLDHGQGDPMSRRRFRR